MDIFQRFKSAIKIREVHIDNNVFQLHYRVTALLLLGCAALVASKQHFGDPIDCITRDDVPNKIMDTYCWIHATFTLPDACNKTVGTEVAHPCVDKSEYTKDERIYHKYYQWVYFVLFFQALSFYAPHFLWKSCESTLLKTLTAELRDPLFKEAEKAEFAGRVVTYLHRNRFRHQKYYYYFTFFEVVNFLNVFLQVYIVDEFLGGTFTTYGLDVLNYIQLDQDERVDPMVRIFPRMTKCTFHRFGSSGDVQRHDALCILPLNIINEKIYIIMWFWFAFLAFVTALWLVHRLYTFLNPRWRYETLRRQASLTPGKTLRSVLRLTDTGDWFLYSMLCKNTDSQWFRYIMNELANKLKADEKTKLEEKALEGRRQNSFNRRPSRQNRRADKHREESSEDELELDEHSSSGADSQPLADDIETGLLPARRSESKS